MARVPKIDTSGLQAGNLAAIRAIMQGGQAQAASKSRLGATLGGALAGAGQTIARKKEAAANRALRQDALEHRKAQDAESVKMRKADFALRLIRADASFLKDVRANAVQKAQGIRMEAVGNPDIVQDPGWQERLQAAVGEGKAAEEGLGAARGRIEQVRELLRPSRAAPTSIRPP